MVLGLVVFLLAAIGQFLVVYFDTQTTKIPTPQSPKTVSSSTQTAPRDWLTDWLYSQMRDKEPTGPGDWMYGELTLSTDNDLTICTDQQQCLVWYDDDQKTYVVFLVRITPHPAEPRQYLITANRSPTLKGSWREYGQHLTRFAVSDL